MSEVEQLRAALTHERQLREEAERERDEARAAASVETVEAGLADAEDRVEALEEALQPFADEASAYDEAKPYPDEDAHLGGFSDYTFGDLLRARSLLDGQKCTCGYEGPDENGQYDQLIAWDCPIHGAAENQA